MNKQQDNLEEKPYPHIEVLQACLTYCREQNGLEHCKNCGLSPDKIDGAISRAHQKGYAQGLREAVERMSSIPLPDSPKDHQAFREALKDKAVAQDKEER